MNKAEKKAYDRQRYLAKKESILAHNRAYNKAHPDAVRKASRKWMRNHTQHSKEYNRTRLYGYLDTKFFKWEQVEGYDGWTINTVVHHRLEDKGYTRDELKAIGAYYNCCPEDLICLTPSEHGKRHVEIDKRLGRSAGWRTYKMKETA